MNSRFPCGGALFVAWVAFGLCAPARASDSIPVGPTPDITGPRTLGLASTIGTASGNEGLFVNPAAIAARKRYCIELGGLLDRRDAQNVGEVVNVSIVDGISTPITAGLAWNKIPDGTNEGTVSMLALAGPLGQGFFIGASGKWFKLNGPTSKLERITVDAGLFWQASEYVSIGIAGYNLVPTGDPVVAPKQVGGGLAIGTDRLVQVTAEWTSDLDASPKTLNRYAAGVEGLLARQFPVRIGFVRDERLDARWWSVGAGAVQPRFGVDIGYRQGIDDPKARVLSASVKLYFLE